MTVLEERAARERHPSAAAGSGTRFATVQMAVLPTAELLAEVGGHADPWSELTDAERERARLLQTASDRDDFVAAHLLARRCVARLTGATDVVLEQRCAECGGDHGKPSVVGHPGISVSWSHSRGAVGAVAAFDPVGIDVEAAVDRDRDVAALVRRTATEAEGAWILASGDPERAYLRMWVAKEALVKVGVLSVGGFRHVDVGHGTHAGFDLTVSELGDVVVGLARRPLPR